MVRQISFEIHTINKKLYQEFFLPNKMSTGREQYKIGYVFRLRFIDFA